MGSLTVADDGAAPLGLPAKGFFLSLEGIDGCGKTTQVRLLTERLSREGLEPLMAREPGGTQVGDLVRGVLLEARQLQMQPLTELLLFFASRAENAQQVIRPALRDGRIVVCDRFTDASVAYQGHGRGLGGKLVESLKTLVLGDLEPDLTIWLDIPVGTALARAFARLGDQDRMESLGPEFFRRVRGGYAKIAADNPSRVLRIDASGTASHVADRVYKAVAAALDARNMSAARS
ncbi:MAG: dTMP kinase [Bryobacterales bacterium]|nr:dTMP kinase [Bryobacterales bacterium]